jgi:hypothetical protein
VVVPSPIYVWTVFFHGCPIHHRDRAPIRGRGRAEWP